MTGEVDERTGRAHESSVLPLATTPVVGTPARAYAPMLVPGTEPLSAGEIRVTIPGSGDPWVRRSQGLVRSWSRSATLRRTSSAST